MDLVNAPVVRPRDVPASFGQAGPGEALDAAGGVPGGAESKRSLLVVVNDPDRATRTAEALAAIRVRAGTRRIDLLVATGSHRWDTARRLAHAAPLLAAAGEGTRVHWHDGHDAAQTMELPGSRRRVSRFLLLGARRADVLAIGSVEPHWFAGATGAHKALSIGLFAAEEIARNHRSAMSPDARPFRLAGNPVHDDLAPNAAEVIELTRAVAVQHIGDRWLAGNPLETLPALADAARARWLSRVPKPLGWAVCKVGPPLSRTLYQAEKAVKHAEFAVRDGGTLVLVAGCEDGIGPARFVEMMAAAPDEASMRARIAADGYRLGDHKAVRLRALLGRGVRLVVVSETFGKDAARTAGFEVARALRSVARNLSGDGVVVEDAAHCVLEAGE